ncbi:MAG: hypothetical protein WHS86_09805 [Desulfosoma sp.]
MFAAQNLGTFYSAEKFSTWQHFMGSAGVDSIQNRVAGSGRTLPVENSQGDLLSLSPALQALSRSGVRLDESWVMEKAQALSFSLRLEEQSLREVKADGRWNLEAQSLAVDFSFQAAVSFADEETGESVQRLVQFDFHLEASRVSLEQGVPAGEATRDILDVARNVMKKAFSGRGRGAEKGGRAMGLEDLESHLNPKKLLKAVASLVHEMQKMLRNGSSDVWRGPHGAEGGSGPDDRVGDPLFQAEITSFQMSYHYVSQQRLEMGSGAASSEGATVEAAEETAAA